ncbi:hypothetical protein HDU67_000339 [Dinochytrium kinnereticum]|nr:hypothetical protein HDU67_000339 [Dinochytrium kinnereticum]
MLNGYGGQPLRIMNTKIDFGPTDIHYDKIMRKIFIENRDPSQAYTLLPEYSSNEILANNGKDILCLPGEGKSWDVSFFSRITGQRQEALQLFAANTVLPPIELHAFSGPAISVPLMEEIIFPTAQTSQSSSVLFPITNLSNTITQCLVSITPSAPFIIQLLDPEYANRKTLERISLILEAKPFEGPDSIGVLVTIGPRLTAVLEISFFSSTWGTFRVPLTTMMVKPRKLNICTHFLSAVAINEVYLSREAPLDLIRRFLKSPKFEPTTGLMLKKTPDTKNSPSSASLKASEVFDLEPIPQIFFKPQGDGTDDIQQFITLSNLSVSAQKYHIALSYPFYTTVELEGSLDALSSIDIPLFLNEKAFDSTFEKEVKGLVALGQITVFDEHQKMGMVSAAIHGTIMDLVSLEVREDTELITFPPLRVMEKYSRRMYIHNKAPFEVVWEGRFSSKLSSNLSDSFGQQTPIPDWCPFGLNSTRISLKPYEYGTIDVMFQATSSGDYKALLSMDYIDPVQRIVNNEKQRSKSKRQLLPLDFRCLVGLPEVELETNYIHFGDVIIEDLQSREIQLTNDQAIDAKVLISTPKPFFTDKALADVPRTSTDEVEVFFQSVLPKSYYEILTFTCGKLTKTIPVMATSGISKLSSNLAPPLKLTGTSAGYTFADSIDNLRHCIDFGIVNTMSPKTKTFHIRNLGTFEYLIKNIALGDDGHLSWKFVDEFEHSPLPKSEDSEEFWDDVEIDWDEVDFKAKDDRINSGGNMQPALQIWDKKLEFGIKAVHSRHQSELKFSNTATIPLNWTLKKIRTKYLPIKRFDPVALPRNEAMIPSPLEVFPTSGKLYPGCTQAIDVIFSPSLPQYEVFSYLVLQTEDFAETPISIHGIGASSRLIPDKNELDFGVLRVGTQREYRLKLRNRGILQTRYFVECGNGQFAADPEQGLLEGDGIVEITVRFAPKNIGQVVSALKILPQSAESYKLDPIVIKLLGMGSYPELIVHTKLVDFGTALFGSPNYKPISVENKGSAEARVIFTCHHPAVRLEGGNNGEVLLPANSKQDLNIIYTPQVVEYLDVKVFVRSSDSRGDYFMIQIKGSVGVPKLTLDPPSILQDLDFGVCSVNSRQIKTFKMKNEGNISLTYRLAAEPYDSASASSLKKRVVDIEPAYGVLGVGDVQAVIITFAPEELEDYKYKLLMAYDFRSLTAIVRGIGGRAILRLESPLRIIDFGTCRLNRVFRKAITVSNAGNLGVDFHVRPEGTLKDWEITENTEIQNEGSEKNSWIKDLQLSGFRILNPDSHCKPYSQTNVIMEYEPQIEAMVSNRLRVHFGADTEDIEVRGRAALPRLSIYSSSNEPLTGLRDTLTVDLGVHPVNSEYVHTLQMVNEGPFGIDYLVQPVGIREFDIFPLRGFIEPNTSAPLKVFFRPNSESKFQMLLKVLWEREPLKINILGSGGIGKLEISYIDEKDISLKGLDFGMIPFNSASEKRFFLYNVGLVPITVQAEVDHDEYTITQIGDTFPNQKQGVARLQNKRTVWNWHNSLRATLPPSMGVELAARFISRSPATSLGNISIKSECRDILIPMRGKGGTIAISHKGELSFGDIASNFTYSRKIVISNNGSIPSTLSLEWLVVGHSSEPTTSYVKLADTYSALDPRSGWAKTSYLKEKGISDVNYKLHAREHWKLIAKIIRKGDAPEAPESSKIWGLKQNPSKDFVTHNAALALNISNDSSLAGTESVTGMSLPVGPFSSGMETRSRLTSSQSSYSVLHGKKGPQTHFSTLFKRRQMLFHLVTNTQMSSQSVSNVRPYLKVDPPSCTLPSFGEVAVNVEIHLSTEDTFLATLLVKPNVPNTPVYEIPLTATPKAVSIMCDDTRVLNFFRQPLGESETITRNFTNIGHKDINFKFLNPNSGLIIVPSKGQLKVGQSQAFQFIFRPMDEMMQNADVIFDPDCSQPIRLKMNGAGGFAKASLAKYRRFDFGHCMIGKDTTSLLPITNEGNAILHLTRFDLFETETFFKGMDWPSSRISLFPGETFNLAIVFNPHEESPAPGKLVIGTNTESWEIELIGLGREAVLIVSKVALEFTECLIGNSYERKLGLKNVGDVNYPVTFRLEKEFPDLEFIPESLVINPFSESYVIVSYTPTKETKSTVVMTISSPYSIHKVPVLLHAGTAILEFNEEEIDFGMFERVSRPSTKLVIKNVGTVKTSYSVKDMAKPSMFQLANSKGLLLPGRSADVIITHIRHEVCEFTERLIIRSDLIDKFYYIRIKGQCEEALLRADEFSLLSMGICPVLESTTKQLYFTNYGRFPLEYSIKSAYPLKVAPTFGVVAGGDTAVANVSWNPSGGYELRTQLTIVTNIGNFNVIVRGKAAFPELAIKNMYLDFGVCAVGHTYTEKFTLTNKGKVPLHFNIPPLREVCYSVSTNQGYLNVKESSDIDVSFRPNAFGRFANSFIVECKGISYKEIVVVGIGGQMKLDISPPIIDIGRSPCDLRVFHVIMLTNNGDVNLYVDWSLSEDPNMASTCSITLPDPVVVPPGRMVRCIFGATAHMVGPISSEIMVKTREKSYSIPIFGTGVKIILTKRSRKILESENLPALTAPGPFGREIEAASIEDNLKRLRRVFIADLAIVETLGTAMDLARTITEEDIVETSTITAQETARIEEIVEAEVQPKSEIADSVVDIKDERAKSVDPHSIPLPPSLPMSPTADFEEAELRRSIKITEASLRQSRVISPDLEPRKSVKSADDKPLENLKDDNRSRQSLKSGDAEPRQNVKSAAERVEEERRESVKVPSQQESPEATEDLRAMQNVNDETSVGVEPRHSVKSTDPETGENIDAEPRDSVKSAANPEMRRSVITVEAEKRHSMKSPDPLKIPLPPSLPMSPENGIDDPIDPHLIPLPPSLPMSPTNIEAETTPLRSLRTSRVELQKGPSREEVISRPMSSGIAIGAIVGDDAEEFEGADSLATVPCVEEDLPSTKILKELRAITNEKRKVTQKQVEELADTVSFFEDFFVWSQTDYPFLKFLDLKRQNYVNSESSEEDPIITGLIEHARLQIRPLDLSIFTDLVEPGTQTDISVILQRPPPILKDEPQEGADDKGPKKQKPLKYHEYMTLDRSRRNAKTVGFFR